MKPGTLILGITEIVLKIAGNLDVTCGSWEGGGGEGCFNMAASDYTDYI